MHHVYAQYFHPETILERVRDVSFYRRPRTIFKGFRVPDWAQSQKMHGWDVDAYSRQAWQNALHDVEAEWTPKQFGGERQEPNPLQFFRFEHFWGGYGNRFFYNEVPKLTWKKQKGHMFADNSEQEKDRMLYSFTHANQDRELMFGLDTSTPEGAEAFRKEYETLCELAPEIIKKDEMVMPHEMPAKLSDEPHFQRVWQHYREHAFKLRFAEAVDAGVISESDAAAFSSFVGMAGTPTFGLFFLARTGQLAHLERDEGYQATQRVLDALQLGNMEFSNMTAMPLEDQFWQQFDGFFQLTETSMRKELPNFISDPSNLAKVQALIDGGAETASALPTEETRQIA